MVQPDGVNFRVQTSIGDSLGLMNVFSGVYDAAHLQAAGVAVKSNHRCRFYYSSAATICELMHGSERRQETALLITLWRKCGPAPRGGLRSALSEEHQPPLASSRRSHRLISPSADSLLPLTTAAPDLCSLSLRTDTKKSNFSFTAASATFQ